MTGKINKARAAAKMITIGIVRSFGGASIWPSIYTYPKAIRREPVK
jgi:hypothetical protein